MKKKILIQLYIIIIIIIIIIIHQKIQKNRKDKINENFSIDNIFNIINKSDSNISLQKLDNNLNDNKKNTNNFNYDYSKETDIIDFKEAKNIEIDDLIKLGDEYLKNENKNYSFNLKGIFLMKNALLDLKQFVGMKKIKKKIINQIIYFSQTLHHNNQNEIQQDKIYTVDETCLDDNNDLLHTVIQGPPGIGKTMLAKILCRIYLCLGITKKYI